MVYLCMCVCICFSLMQASCDIAFKYAHEREQFGQKIGTFQVHCLCNCIVFEIFLTYHLTCAVNHGKMFM